MQITRVVQFVLFVKKNFQRNVAKKHALIRAVALVLYLIIGGLMTVLWTISAGTMKEGPIDRDNENNDDRRNMQNESRDN